MNIQQNFKIAWIASALLTLPQLVWAADAKPAQPAPAPAEVDADTGAEKVNVENIKEKYWARGEQAELSVVQNRAYSKKNHFEFTLFGGVLATDPFLSVQNIGGSLGYHFSEYFSVALLGWRSFSGPSSALTAFQTTIGATTDTNPPLGYLGAEARASFLYGKLSLLGKKIIYYDMSVMGGVGATDTSSGIYLTPHVGIGEQVWLSKYISVKVDYRLMFYNETILEQVIPTKLGQPVGTRFNFTHAVTVGVGFLFGGGSK